MGIVNITLPSDGTTADVADYNTPITTLKDEFNGGIDNDNIDPSAAIDPAKIAGLTAAAFGAWQSWTPTLTGITVGNGALACKYIQVGKTVRFKFSFTLGSTSAVSGASQFTLPVTSVSYTAGSTTPQYGVTLGVVSFKDDSAAGIAHGPCLWYDTTHATLDLWNVAGTYMAPAAITSTIPFTWTTNDVIGLMGVYEAA